MVTKGAGARAAWHVESRKVFADLRRLFADESLQKLEFDAGERIWLSVSAGYQRAKNMGSIAKERFSDIRRLRLAASREIVARGPGDLYIFLQYSERQGVYRAPVQAIARHAAELLEYDRNRVCIASQDGGKGTVLDWETDSLDGIPYELEVWG